jgi:hypothetical protein
MRLRDGSISPRRVLTQFERSGGSGAFSKPFSDLPAGVRDHLNREMALAAGEEPILASYFDEGHWTVFTTTRLISRDRSTTQAMRLLDVVGIGITEPHVHEAGAKDSLRELKIRMADGSSFDLRLESGPPFFGFWNALKLVAP